MNKLYFWFFEGLNQIKPALGSQCILYSFNPDSKRLSARRFDVKGQEMSDETINYSERSFENLHTDYVDNKVGWRSLTKCQWARRFRDQFGRKPEFN